jgi:phosphatidate cytidylyltransferase
VDDNGGIAPPDPENEGIRIIGPQEAAEAAARDDVAHRRSEREPRYGDRPSETEAQPKGPRPTLRFPLPDSPEPADIDRPKVKPPTRMSDKPPDQPRSLFSIGSDAPPADEPEQVDDTAGIRIPHWTEPATGEVPAVLGGEGEDEEAWQSFADSSPRWRDDSKDFDERDDIAILADGEDRMGALDPDAPGEHELVSFDDLGAATDPRRPAGERPRKKVAAKKAGPRAAPPVDSGTTRAAGAPTGRGPRVTAPRVGSGSARPGPGGAGGRPSGGDRDLTTAAAVGVALGVGALVLLKLGPGFMMVLVSAIVLLAAAEFFTTTRRAGYVPAQLLGIVACVALPLATFWKGTLAFPVVLGLAVMGGFLWYIIGAGDERPTMNLGITQFGVAWIGVLGSFAGLLLGAPDGSSLMLSVLLVAVAHDVGAYFIGQSMGRAPLTAISPGKTIEGLAGGVVSAVVMALVVVGFIGEIGFFGESIGRALVFGLVVGIATAVGDLCESVVKRDLGVKDMGNILPGHGGILDRMDGILFAMPAAWYLLLWLG